MNMMTITADMISSGHGLLEAPWFDREHGFIYTDAERGGVWQLAGATAHLPLVAHRRGIGGMAMHAAGGLIVSGRNVAFKALEHSTNGNALGSDHETVVLLENDPDNGHVGFNDLVTDARGRVYVGSLGFVPMLGQSEQNKTGSLHLIDLDGSVREVAKGIRLSNGLGFSADGTRLYHADSVAHVIYLYDVAGDGSLGRQRVFAAPAEGMPDGLAVAADGSVWVALVHAGQVVAYDAGGKEIHRIALPTPMVTSLCFGGSDGKDLYIVSGAHDAPRSLGGCIYRARVDVAGVPRHPARIALTQKERGNR